MEVDEIQTQATKLSRVGNKRNESSKIGHKGNENYPDDEEDRAVIKRASTNGAVANALVDTSVGANRLRGWHHSSRIIRVSRASGGKDRHSKVWTSKGLRDRRVRLSVATAIQFYDLQDRLGVDQPSKAIEWLINAAADAVAELPSLNASFPGTPKQLSDENRANEGAEQGFDSAEVELDHQQNQSQHLSLSKSACSSTSETSKNSGLSLSKSDIRVNREKARERARERAAKEKEKEQESSRIAQQQNTSFTELLTCGIGSVSNNNTSPSPTASSHQNTRQWPVTQMDYFTGLLGPSSSAGFPGQIQRGNSMPQQILIPSAFTMSGENHQELQHFSFIPNADHLTTQAAAPGGDYNLNFTMSSSGLAGFNRGTLQSNSPFLPHQLHMFSSIEGSYSSPFYIGPPQAVDNNQQHQFPAGLDGRLHLCYGDGSRTSDHKGKGNN